MCSGLLAGCGDKQTGNATTPTAQETKQTETNETDQSISVKNGRFSITADEFIAEEDEMLSANNYPKLSDCAGEAGQNTDDSGITTPTNRLI